ncbi:hypothetical protein [Lysinibacillus xylanilyticus]|uniref:hypothetical protein n=1 Tax=Lysinibacillus xylanilyticus TaxID=582475 RepID=UPI0036DE00C3
MDLIVRIGEFLLIMIGVSAMLFLIAGSVVKINETQEYVTKQNNSDAYANRYASLSSFDADSVGKISVQEALDLIYTYAQDSTPVIVKGPDNVVHVYVTDSGGWRYSSNGKPLGRKIDGKGNYYDGTYNTNIGAIDVATEQVPDYKDLYNYLSNNQYSDVYYLGNINPDNQGNLKTVLLKATN